ERLAHGPDVGLHVFGVVGHRVDRREQFLGLRRDVVSFQPRPGGFDVGAGLSDVGAVVLERLSNGLDLVRISVRNRDLPRTYHSVAHHSTPETRRPTPSRSGQPFRLRLFGHSSSPPGSSFFRPFRKVPLTWENAESR